MLFSQDIVVSIIRQDIMINPIMTGANFVLMYPGKERFFLFNKEQHGVVENKYTEKRGIMGGSAIPYPVTLDKSPNLLGPRFPPGF